jgi:20S proteasome alpha/beta subunit
MIMRIASFSSLLYLINVAVFISVSFASSSVKTTPVTNWETSFAASSLQGTVVVIPCKTETEDALQNENALLVLLQKPSNSVPSFTILDRAFVAWTGFAVDVECLTNELLQFTDDHVSIYNQGPKNVATFLASRVRKEAFYQSGRPYAVQTLVVQQQRVWTIDPSGSCILWSSGATAMGREAAAVRKQLHKALQAHATIPTVTQALRIALEALSNCKTSTREIDLPRVFLLTETKEQSTESNCLRVKNINDDIVREQLQELSLKSNDDDDNNKSKNASKV